MGVFSNKKKIRSVGSATHSQMLLWDSKMVHCWARFSFKEYLVLAILLTGIQTVCAESDDGSQNFIRCFNDTGRHRLYLGLEDLVVDCMLVTNSKSSRQSQYQLNLYAAAGLLPKIEISNRTNVLSFTFELNMNTTTWRATVPRHNITIMTEIAPVDQWYFEISMFHGFEALNAKAKLLETLKGTLLDVAREPILQWTIGEELSPQSIKPHEPLITKIRVTQSPCASDVAVMAPIFRTGGHTGVILSVTNSAFTSSGRWFNVTTTLCGLINDLCTSGCTGISIVDLKLTNCYLFLLTNRGLFISQDLLSPPTEPLKFSLLFLPALAQMDYTTTTLWFSPQCVTNRLYFAGDFVSLISNEGAGNQLHSRCVYSGYPFTEWHDCKASAVERNKNVTHRYLSFVHDRYQHTGLLVSHSEEEGGMLSVFNLQRDGLKNLTKFSPAKISLRFRPNGIFLRENHVIFYGNEVWLSSDRGFSFTKASFTLYGDAVKEVVSCTYNSSVLLLTAKGIIFLLKPDLMRFAHLNERIDHQTALLCDHMGVVMAIKVNSTQQSSLSYRVISIKQLIQESGLGFNRPIVIQYTRPSSVLLHEYKEGYTPNLSPSYVGKIFSLSSGGKVVITAVGQQHFVPGYLAFAEGEVIETLRAPSTHAEPLQSDDLLLQNLKDSWVLMKSRNESLKFDWRHVGMSVVCPGKTSFLIQHLHRDGSAYGKMCMPALAHNNILKAHTWLFLEAKGWNSWSLYEGPCRHKLQSLDNLRRNSLVRINVRETLSFTFKAYMSDYSLSMTRNKKLMMVILTNPNAMRVNARHYWDKANNHMLNLTIYSHLCKKVNYRPPSQLGVLIPTSENIYNADPSQQYQRQHYPVSKASGHYKQCAGKVSAEECGCTDGLRVSPLAINSDCRMRVLRKMYPLTNFNITLYLRRTNRPNQPLRSPYFVTVTEVNNRTNWAVTGTHITPTLVKMRQYFSQLNQTVYNSEGLQISCYGSELFHFRIAVIPGVVLCDLVEEVQIYVDKAPLAFPAAYLISCMTAIALGGFLLLGFLLRNVTPPTTSSVKAFLTSDRAKVAPAEKETEN
ncbi:cation channel sperm-associated auxiliary subunit beta-like isoform X2 [Sardina pilchardus]|uniref:cation channel sperm-associated auxiliary subunit beta-like isoform X2 n=1 Tax=Sardina pilchardus TaxID=27697 RepID=UPI002E13CA17